MLQLHLSDQKFNCLLRCDLYKRLDGKQIRCRLTSIGIPIIKKRLSHHSIIFIMEIPYMKDRLHIEMGALGTQCSVSSRSFAQNTLTHWGRVTHICVGTNTNIGSDNGLSPGRRKAIIWTKAGILLIGPLGTNFSEILSEIHTFSFKKMHFKTLSAK